MAKDDLGRILVERGLLTRERLEEAYQHQVIYGGSLDTNLLEMGMVEEEALLDALGASLRLPAVPPDVLATVDPEKVKVFPQKLAQKYALVPFKLEGRNLWVALHAVVDLSTLDDIGFMLSVYLRPHAALEVRIHQALLRMYGIPLSARFEHLLAQMGNDVDEDRAAFEKRTGVAVPQAGEQWVAQEPAKKEPAPPPPSSSSSPAPTAPVPEEPIPAFVGPTALGGLLGNALEPLPEITAPSVEQQPAETAPPVEQKPVEAAPPVEEKAPVAIPDEDPEAAERRTRRTERVSWRLADARAEFALATTRDDIVEVLLRFAYKALDYAAVFVLQGARFTGWDSIGEGQAPRSIGHIQVPLTPGSALALVESTASHYLGPLKPEDPLPAALGRARPKVVLLVPFFVKGRLVGVLYGDRGNRNVAPRAVADVQALVPDLGRTLEGLILRQKRARLGFVDEHAARGTGIREALGEGPRRGSRRRGTPISVASVPPSPVVQSLPPDARPQESLPPVPSSPEPAAPPAVESAVPPSSESLPPLPPPAEEPVHPSTGNGVRSDTPTLKPEAEPPAVPSSVPPQIPREDTLFDEPSVKPPPAQAPVETPPAPVPDHGPAAEWTSWESLKHVQVPISVDAAPVQARQGPPPLPRKKTLVMGSTPPPLPPDEGAAPSAVDPMEATARHLAELLKEAETASADELLRLADAIVRSPKERRIEELFEKAQSRGRDAQPALETLSTSAHKPLAVAHALRIFPGMLASNVFEEQDKPDPADVSPLARVVLGLGDVASALAAAVGMGLSRREARYLAVLIAARVKHPAIAELVVRGIFDVEPRIAYLSADTLDAMLLPRDSRAPQARAALNVIRTALEKGNDEQRFAAARAAGQVHHAPFAPALIELLDGRNRDLADLALAGLRELTHQDFGNSPRRWRAWWRENGARRRIEWLLDALGHKERELRQGAQRELHALTGEYLGYHHDAPRVEREAAVGRWRAWWEQNRSRLDLP